MEFRTHFFCTGSRSVNPNPSRLLANRSGRHGHKGAMLIKFLVFQFQFVQFQRRHLESTMHAYEKFKNSREQSISLLANSML